MAAKAKILVLEPGDNGSVALVDHLSEKYEVQTANSVIRALALLRHGEFQSVLVDTDDFGLVEKGGLFLQADQILEVIADGVALVDRDVAIIWANPQLASLSAKDELTGSNFFDALGSCDLHVTDCCPFQLALRTRRAQSAVVRRDDNRFFRVAVTPVCGKDSTVSHLISLTREVTSEVLRLQKLQAIHQAGTELADLAPEELAEMEPEHRIELLKSNILRHTADLLNLDSIEIRLLDRNTKRLVSLLCSGMAPGTADIELTAEPDGNGVTGFVGATGKSYLCEDTTKDPLYLPGAVEAKSSITVALSLHDEVIGTFNVESTEAGAFSEEDVQFLEIYARDVALALHTFELLQAQKVTAASESVDLISREVALPVDGILREATRILERYIGHEPEVADRLRRILDQARDIKQVIQNIGEKLDSTDMANVCGQRRPYNPLLVGRRILVVDNDEEVRRAAHDLLGRYGCTVETAADGHEGVTMARISQYDVFIADIRLPDMGGYEIFSALREHQPSAVVNTHDWFWLRCQPFDR